MVQVNHITRGNTHMVIPKTSQNQQLDANLVKPISNTELLTGGQKTDSYVNSRFLSKDDLVKSVLNRWIDGTYHPTHFLSIQLPENLRCASKENAISHLRNIMIEFERYLLKRHWNKKHLPFICFEEKCVLYGWHFHILLNKCEFTEQQLRNAIFKVNIRLQLPSYCLDIRPIINETAIICEEYCEKQIRINEFAHFDSDSIILSHDLFHLPYKLI